MNSGHLERRRKGESRRGENNERERERRIDSLTSQVSFKYLEEENRGKER